MLMSHYWRPPEVKVAHSSVVLKEPHPLTFCVLPISLTLLANFNRLIFGYFSKTHGKLFNDIVS